MITNIRLCKCPNVLCIKKLFEGAVNFIHNWNKITNINLNTWRCNKVRELFAVKVQHTSLLNTTVVAFNVLPLGSYAPMPAPSPPFKTILELVLWNGLQTCRCITPDIINVIKWLLASSCLSVVRLYWEKKSPPNGWIFITLILENLPKICRQNSSLIKIR